MFDAMSAVRTVVVLAVVIQGLWWWFLWYYYRRTFGPLQHIFHACLVGFQALCAYKVLT